ncbi:hypothetical protein [Plantactinospora sp. KBS50]|uniref:hypothetical protein n=1 Tax=Plantactinospora sp. KBS50 TaxID=2024580 RepID=UPI000BAAEA8A|nr:hypothetical protein [Plantactinospora sp. KBS50]ASW53098.1 hypothetical protein CIK06_01185 [Plantactinospora sp. KBS50]
MAVPVGSAPVRRAAADDAGRVSIFLAIALLGVFMVIGLSVDGAGELFALHRARSVAAEAARTGGQAIDEGSAINGDPKVLDPRRARADAAAYIAAAGARGWVDEPAPGSRTITAHVEVEYQPVLLRFFGWRPPPTTVQATAQLEDVP